MPWAEVLVLGAPMPGKLTFVAEGSGSFEPTAILIPQVTFAERRIGALVSTFALEEQISNPKANVQDSGRYTVFWEP